MLRVPRFRFRPAQADVLHLDLWVGSLNVLRDAGSFTYNTDAKWLRYFSGADGHNTIVFDGHDPMPRVSRFLFGAWPKVSRLEHLRKDGSQVTFGVGYTDYRGVRHFRRLKLNLGYLTITDEISGFEKFAIMRWRLPQGSWVLHVDGGAAFCVDEAAGISLRIKSSTLWDAVALVNGWESMRYLQKTETPVLELKSSRQCSIVTEVAWRK
jgi:hypothetical protein